MAGWDLSEGIAENKILSDDEVLAIINSLFSSKSKKTTTYKFCFLKCLLDNLFNVDDDLNLNFSAIFSRFAEIYWNLVSKHNLCQVSANSRFQKSSVEIIIEAFKQKYSFGSETSFEALKNELQLELIKTIGSECSKFVIGAFFTDTSECFYSFSKKTKKLLLILPFFIC